MKYIALCVVLSLLAVNAVVGLVCYSCNEGQPGDTCVQTEKTCPTDDPLKGKGCFNVTATVNGNDYIMKGCSNPAYDQVTGGEFKCVEISDGSAKGTFCLCEEDKCN